MATVKTRHVECEWCGTTQSVEVYAYIPLGEHKCTMCRQSLARVIARDIILGDKP